MSTKERDVKRKNYGVVAFARLLIRVFAALLFGLLLFYVCCPYPTRSPLVLPNWTPLEIDAERGKILLQSTDFPDSMSAGEVFWLYDPNLDPPVSYGAFRVVGFDESEQTATLESTVPLSAELSDSLVLSFNDLVLYEKNPLAPPDHYSKRLTNKISRFGPPFLFLSSDPTVGSVSAVSALNGAGKLFALRFLAVVVLLSLILGRVFCGWICPLGFLFDFFDFLLYPLRRVVEGRFRFFSEKRARSYIRVCFFFFLLGTLLSGIAFFVWVLPIPTLTRNIAFIFGPVETAFFRSWEQTPATTKSAVVSLVIFGVFLSLGVFERRLFCRLLCPAGTLFYLLGFGRVWGWRVERQKCVGCRRCERECSFDAITNVDSLAVINSNCAACGKCASVCPKSAIAFGRRSRIALTPRSPSLPNEKKINRRVWGKLSFIAVASFLGVKIGKTANVKGDAFVRPPGALDEERFLQSCVRCGECFQACPNDALRPLDLDAGWTRALTPSLNANHSGCEPSCNNCGQVCPTGAIRLLTIEEKRSFAMGRAVVDSTKCLPFAGEECQLCYEECSSAGYNAIEFVAVGTQLDENGRPLEDSSLLAPVVVANRCVGCGLCQARCYSLNVRAKRVLSKSAISVQALSSLKEA